jgi:hypothetical protein
MKRILTALLALGLVVPAWAQEAEKKVEGKQDGDEKRLIDKEGAPPAKKGEPGPEPSIPVKDVDTNGDGMISASELKAALGKMGGTYGGEKKGVKPEGGGEGVKKPPVKVPPKDGGDKAGGK